ncbi:MAG: hypothetical protein PVH80_03310 [Anaerolineae bacterium]|jgi:hypothetical protein
MRRLARHLLTALAGVVVLLVVIRERYDPRLSLYASDMLRSTSEPSTVRLDQELAVRLHATTRPHIGKIASLQKGLVLVHGGRELIEEGYGFGTPIIEVDGVAHISRHAQTSLVQVGTHETLVKAYRIDVIDRPTRFLQVKYQDVHPLGTIVFSYTVRPPDTIDVTVDFSDLDVQWDRAYLMNEQGARAFTRYRTHAGALRPADEVGIWQEATAPFGCWEAPDYDLRFCVDAPPGQAGFVGRERYNQYNWLGVYMLSWSGIDIQVEAPLETYTYSIRVEKQASAGPQHAPNFAQHCPEQYRGT